MKKVFAMIMAAMMLMAMLAGCQSAENADANVIKVGTSGPLQGDYAVYGVAVKNGLELAFEEINALGGLQFAVNGQVPA